MSLEDTTSYPAGYLKNVVNADMTRVELQKYQDDTLSVDELGDQEGKISSIGTGNQNLAWPRTSSSVVQA